MVKGLWSREVYLKIVNENSDKNSFMVMESAASEDSLPAVSIDGIMKEYAINGIDILKIDIEGAEKEVFAFDYEN